MERHDFIRKAALASTAATGLMALSVEERGLLAQQSRRANDPMTAENDNPMPMGRIQNIEISRLIGGGNLVASYAHSRDLIYVSSLFREYFTDEKIIETYQIQEENGINTLVLNNSTRDIRAIELLNQYNRDNGGHLQWIAQLNPTTDNPEENILIARDHGAVGGFIQGLSADRWVSDGNMDLIHRVVSIIRSNGMIAGVGGHNLTTTMACESDGVDNDFYMKTFHSPDYWSFNPSESEYGVDGSAPEGTTHDNVWDTRPEETAEFMATMSKPWLAYKTLAAGAIRPSDGFRYAYENGADFLVVGMFDFQVAEDVNVVKNVLSTDFNRSRPWRA